MEVATLKALQKVRELVCFNSPELELTWVQYEKIFQIISDFIEKEISETNK